MKYNVKLRNKKDATVEVTYDTITITTEDAHESYHFSAVEEINHAVEDLKCEQPEWEQPEGEQPEWRQPEWDDIEFIHFFSDVDEDSIVYLDILEKIVLNFLRQNTIDTMDGSDVEFDRNYDNGCLVDECTGVV